MLLSKSIFIGLNLGTFKVYLDFSIDHILLYILHCIILELESPHDISSYELLPSKNQKNNIYFLVYDNMIKIYQILLQKFKDNWFRIIVFI